MQHDRMAGEPLIRELRNEDFDYVAELMNLRENEGLTGDLLRERNAHWDEGDSRLMLVAESSGTVIACGRSVRRQSDPKGKFNINIFVHPDFERRGLGRELLARTETFAREHSGGHLITNINDSSARGHMFLERNGFQCVQHLFESILDLSKFDPADHLDLKRNLENEGYVFHCLDDLGNTEENWRRIHELDSTTDLDTPGFENWGLRPFDRYCREVRDFSGFSPKGAFIAEWKGEWVGLHMVKRDPRPNEMRTDYTGVRREHRGKGLAQALKALGAEYAKRTGAKTLLTNNDERNVPMLAVNLKFGFVVQPGFKTYRKDL